MGRCSIARLSVTKGNGGDLTVAKPGRGLEVIFTIAVITKVAIVATNIIVINKKPSTITVITA